MNNIKTKGNHISRHISLGEELTDYLNEDPANAQDFLETALVDFQEDGNAAAFLLALRYLAQAQEGGMTRLAQQTHLNRKAIYKALSPTGNPRLNTLRSIIKALGFRLSAHREAIQHYHK